MPDGRKWVQLIAETPLSSCFIRTEKNRLMQVINNFLTNAIKFTQKEASHSDTRYAIKCYTSMSQIRDAAFLPIKKILYSDASSNWTLCTRHRTGAFHLPDNHRAHEWNDRSGIRGRKGSTFWFTIPYQPARLSEKRLKNSNRLPFKKTNWLFW